MEDMSKYEQLANDVYVYGSVSLALAMAKETNLIQGLCTAQQPLSSSLLASQLQLKERYVREVLNSLTVAGLVQLEKGTGGKEGEEARYWVPHSCRQVLQKTGVLSLSVSSSARRFADIRECFDREGPNCVRYDPISFVMIDELALILLDNMTEAILETPGLKRRFEEGLKALDVGCATGRVSLRLAAMFPKSHFILSDISSRSLESARQQAEKDGVTNVSFQLLDVCQVPDDLQENFDWVLSRIVIHDLPHPLKALQGICKALKPGGHFSLVDIFVSSHLAENSKSWKEAAAWYAVSAFHCLPESYQQPDSEALGACWGSEKASELVKTAGMNVLGMKRTQTLDSVAVCMCQKPE